MSAKFIDDKIKSELVRHTAYTVRRIAEGQQMDINFEEEETVNPELYLEMIRLKTSILFGSAAYGGALIGGKEIEEANEEYKYDSESGNYSDDSISEDEDDDDDEEDENEDKDEI